MSSFLSAILQPMEEALDRWFDSDGQGVDFSYLLLTIFFVFGIWLVFERYQRMDNRPIPFEHRAPDVRIPAVFPSLLCFDAPRFAQAANPGWESKHIPDAHLKSHLDDADLRPPMEHPERSYITSFDPATGLHIGTFLADNADEIRAKIRRAADAQREWRETTFRKRRRVVRSLMKWLVENQKECAQVACRDTGKTRECRG
jgi:hypothetical protein